MLIDCPSCRGERAEMCPACSGNGCAACRSRGGVPCRTCDGQGTVDSQQFRAWCAGQTPKTIIEEMDRIVGLNEQLGAVNAYLDAAVDWIAEEDAWAAKQQTGGNEQ